MNYLHDRLKALKWDKRLLDYNKNTGVLSEQEWQDYANQLPDLKDRAETLSFEQLTEGEQNEGGDSFETSAAELRASQQHSHQQGFAPGSHQMNGNPYGSND